MVSNNGDSSALVLTSLPAGYHLTTQLLLQLKVKVTLRLTGSGPVSLGVKPQPGPKTRYFLLSVVVLLMWGALSNERKVLSFAADIRIDCYNFEGPMESSSHFASRVLMQFL
jgi:hypothetical protein